jgi:uncharacterized membrane protein
MTVAETERGPAPPEAIEARWPIALTIVVFIAITVVLRLVLPHRQSVATPRVVPAIEVLLPVALLAANPARVDRRGKSLRYLSIALILSLAVAAIWSTLVLSTELLRGDQSVTSSADSLLASGSLIWLGNNLVFALLYWEFDGGGAYVRAREPHEYLDFSFPQPQNPELAPPGWRPKFVDYLYLGLTNATAFSPTDTMPLATWAKLTMALQSLVSLVVFALVISTAVNVLG